MEIVKGLGILLLLIVALPICIMELIGMNILFDRDFWRALFNKV